MNRRVIAERKTDWSGGDIIEITPIGGFDLVGVFILGAESVIKMISLAAPCIMWSALPTDGPLWIYILIGLGVFIPSAITLTIRLGFFEAIKLGMVFTTSFFVIGGLFCTFVLGMPGLFTDDVSIFEIIGLPFIGWALSVLPAAIAGAISTALNILELIRNRRKQKKLARRRHGN